MTDLSLAGHAGAFPLTPGAKLLILDYLARARQSTRTDPDGDETVRDVETAIGDHLHTVLHDGGRLDETTVGGILEQFGPLAVPEHAATNGRAPFLCRIDDGKQISGLWLGIATRTDLRVDWVRSIAVILGLFTGGLLVLAYLVALLFAPRLQTVAEYQALLRRDKLLRDARTSRAKS